MSDLTLRRTYARVRRVIANDVGLPGPASVRGAMALASPPLKYDADGMRALAALLRAEFTVPGIPLSKADVINAGTVLGLQQRVWAQVKDAAGGGS